MKLSDLYKRALSLLYVPRCAACRDRLPPDGGALCEGCRLRYELQKSERCPFCGETLAHCLCPSEALRRAGVREVVKLFEYQKNAGEAVANRLVFTLKHRGSAPVVDFFAAELSARLDAQLPSDRDKTFLTFAPRTPAAKRRYGFDHMELLARATAGELRIPFLPLLSRRGGAEQKTLSARRDRFFNMKDAYTVKGGREATAGSHVILLDDVTTSGATLVAAVRALRRAGYRKITVAVLGCRLLR